MRNRDPYPRWYRHLWIAVFLPGRNLGALGVRIGPLYFDLYSRRGWGGILPGLFVSWRGRTRRWITPRGVRKEGI